MAGLVLLAGGCRDRGEIVGSDASDGGSDDAIEPVSDAALFDGMIVSEQTGCHMLSNIAPLVIPNVVGPDASVPTLQGGTIGDGFYELVSVDVYNQTAPTPLFQRTVQFLTGGTVWRIVNLQPAPGQSGGWIIQRPTLSVATETNMLAARSLCSDLPFTDLYLYEATPDSVIMWFEAGGLLLRYARIR